MQNISKSTSQTTKLDDHGKYK